MARSTTKIIKSGALTRDPALASVILRFMMSVNDISIANAALGDEGVRSRTELDRQLQKRLQVVQ